MLRRYLASYAPATVHDFAHWTGLKVSAALMGKVYRHRAFRLDKYLGRIDPASGRVYAARLGPDRYVGRVELTTGRVHASRLGPDRYLGRVDLASGEIYRHRPGPDEYVGRVNPDGKLYGHIRFGRDRYLGQVRDMSSLAEGGAALLLFFLEDASRAGQASQEGEGQDSSDGG